MVNWDFPKQRDEKRLDLPKPIPMIYNPWLYKDTYYSVNLIALTWKTKPHPNAIIQHPDGKVEKIDYYHVENDLFIDDGDGIQTFRDIIGLKTERDKQVKVFNDLIDKLYERVPNLDFTKIIEENEK